MPVLLNLCETYFGCRDLYEVLQISKTATDKEIRKAYHKLSLLVHPDRVDEKDKAEATEKFKVLGKIYTILSSTEKRNIYDETGIFDEDDEDWDDTEGAFFLFKKITDEDIDNYEKSYKGSELEIADLKKAYMNGEGSMDHILETVPFSDEERVREVVLGLIEKKELPEYEIFINEPPENKIRRKKEAAREAARYEKQKEKLKNKQESTDDLHALMKKNQQKRGIMFDSFIENLTAKYGGAKKPRTPSASKTKTRSTSVTKKKPKE